MDVSTEDLRGFTILDVGLVLSHVFGCQAKVNKGYLLLDLTALFVEADHDVFWLEIVIYSSGRVDYFETVKKLFTHGQNLFNLLQAVTLLDVIL